jgi:hypothetical protein
MPPTIPTPAPLEGAMPPTIPAVTFKTRSPGINPRAR